MWHRLRRTLRFLIAAGVALALLLALAWYFRVELFGDALKKLIAEELHVAVGGRYEIEAVGGDWLSELKVHGLRMVETPQAGRLEELRADQVRVTFGLGRLLEGDVLAALDSIRVDGVRVQLNLADPVAADAGGASDPTDWHAVTRWDGRLQVDGDLRLRTDGGMVQLTGVRLAAGEGALQLHVADARLPERFSVHGPLAGEVSPVAHGGWRWTSTSSLGGVRIPTFSVGVDGALEGRVELEAGSLEVMGSNDEVQVATRDFDLGLLPAWLQGLTAAAPWIPAAGRVDLQLVAQSGSWSTPSIALEARGVRWADGVPIDVRGQGRILGANSVAIDSLDAHAEGVQVRVEHAVLDGSLPYGLRQADVLSVDVMRIEEAWPALKRSGSLRVRAHALEGQPLQVDTARYVDGDTSLELRGTIQPATEPDAWGTSRVEGQVTVQVADAGHLHEYLRGSMSVQGAVSGTLDQLVLHLDGQSTDATLAGVDVRSLQARLLVSRSRVVVEEALLRGSAGQVRLAGWLELASAMRLHLRYELAISDLAVLKRGLELAGPPLGGPPLGGPPLGGILRVEGAVVLSEAGWNGIGVFSGAKLALGEQVLGSLRATIGLRENGILQLTQLSLRGPQGVLDAAGSLDLRARRARVTGLRWSDGAMSARLLSGAPLSLRWDKQLIYLPGVRLLVNDMSVSATLEADLSGEHVLLRALDVRAEDHEIRLTRPLHLHRSGALIKTPALSLEIDGDVLVDAAFVLDLAEQCGVLSRLDVQRGEMLARLQRPLSAALHGGRVEVEDLDFSIGDQARVEAAFSVFPSERRGELTRLRVAWGARHAQLAAPAALTWNEEEVRLERLVVAALGGQVRGQLAWSDRLRGRLVATKLALEDVGGPLSGQVDATLDLGEAGARLTTTSLDIRVQRGTGFLPRGPLALDLRQVPGAGLRVEKLSWGGAGGVRILGSGVLPVGLTAWGRVVERPEAAHFEVELNAPHWPGAPEVAVGSLRARMNADASGIQGLVTASDLLWGDVSSTRDDAELVLRVTPSMAQAEVRVVGTESVRVSGRVALDRGLDWRQPGSWQNVWERAQVDGLLNLSVRDWEAVQRLVPGLRTVAGAVSLQVRAQGPLREPRLEADLDVEQFRLRIQGDLPTIADVNARIHWRQELVSIERLEGTLGYAPFRIAGNMRVPPGAPPIFDLTLTGNNLLLSRSRYLRLRSDVDLRLAGALDALRLSGTARIVSAVYSQPLKLQGDPNGDGKLQLFSIRNAPLSRMAFEVRIKSNDQLRVRNNLLSARIGIDATLRGTGEVPEPEGRLTFRDTVVKLPLSTLHGAQGELVFTRESPLNPRILATARSRVKGYELGVRAWGVLPQMEFSVFSRPQLSQEEAVMLLTTGTTRESLRVEGITGSSLQAVLSVFGGAALAPLGSPPDPDRLGFFDRFDVTTGRYTSRTGRSTVEAEFQVSERFFLRGERDRFDETNLGLVWRFRFR